MKKLTVILLFTSIFGFAQIDYKDLIKNLEDVTANTDIETYFEGLPIDNNKNGVIEFSDGRFLRFYGATINSVKIEKDNSGKRTMTITPFTESEDYKKIKVKLIEIYGKPEIIDRGDSKFYKWITDEKEIYIDNHLKNGHYKKNSSVVIVFNQQ